MRARRGEGARVSGARANTIRRARRSGQVRKVDKWQRVQPEHVTGAAGNSKEQRQQEKHTHLRFSSPDNCPALVLNADYQPLSYMPLSLWPWQEVVKAVFLDRVNIVATYDIGIRGPSMILPLPSVISLKQYRPMAVKRPAFTRFNVFLRDLFSCQYCGQRFPTQDLTFDHIVPRCRNGKTNWENVVTACVSCNHRKGRKLVSEMNGELTLKKKPVEPSRLTLQAHARRFPPRNLHESWRDYIYWSQELYIERDEDDEDTDNKYKSSRH